MKKMILIQAILAMVFLSFSLAQELECDVNTVALWHFDEESGSNVNDACILGYNGTINNIAVWTDQSCYGNALELDGGPYNEQHGYVQFDSPILTSQSGTVEACIKLDSYEAVIFNNLDPGHQGGVILAVNTDGSVNFGVKPDTPESSVTTESGIIQLGQWYRIAGVFDVSQQLIAIHINDTLVVSSSDAFSYTTSSTNARIGQLANAFTWNYLDGIIDEIRISNIARDPVVEIDSEANSRFPYQYKLIQNYPNPFNPVTIISYQLPKSAFVNLSIYNIAGQLVETLLKERKDAGFYSVQWNAGNVGSGLYFYRIEAGEYTETKKCVILK